MNSCKAMFDRQSFSFTAFFISVSLAVYPLAGYQLLLTGSVGLSLDRLFVFLAILSLIFSFISGEIRRGRMPVLLVSLFVFHVILVSILFANEINTFFLNMVLVNAYFLIIVLAISNIPVMEKYIIRANKIAAFILIGFGFYSTINFLRTGLPELDLPFVSFIPFIIQKEGELQLSGSSFIGSFIRLTLPFGRPQDYGLATVMTAAILWWGRINSISGRFQSTVLVSTLLVLSILSGSRSIVYSLICAIVFILFIKAKANLRKNSVGYVLKVTQAIVVLFLIIAFIDFQGNLEIFDRLIYGSDSSTTAHMDYRLYAIQEFDQAGFLNMLLGHGAGGFFARTGVHSHVTFLAILFDYGIIGLLLFISLFVYAYLLWLNVKKRIDVDEASVLGGILVFMFFSHTFYEFTTSTVSWIGLAFVIGILMRRRRGINYAASVDKRIKPIYSIS